MRLTERKLRSIIRSVIKESKSMKKSMKFGFENVFSLSPEKARELLENPKCFDDIETLSEDENKTIVMSDEYVKVPYRSRGNDWVKTHFVVLEYDKNEGWSIMWRYADNANWNYTNDIRSYTAGKIIYRGCELHRENIIDYINTSGYQYHPSSERKERKKR